MPSLLAEDCREEAARLGPFLRYIEYEEAHPDDDHPVTREQQNMRKEAKAWSDALMHLEAEYRRQADEVAPVPVNDPEVLRKVVRGTVEGVVHRPFHQRDLIADPLFAGQSEIATYDLAGLAETEIKMKPDLRRASTK